jgi:hypothetical protein
LPLIANLVRPGLWAKARNSVVKKYLTAEGAETSMRRVFAVLQRVEIRLCGAAPPFSLLPCMKTGYYFNITFRTKETGC